jgi:hypothetical protein
MYVQNFTSHPISHKKCWQKENDEMMKMMITILKTHSSTVLEKPLQKVGVTVNPTQIIYDNDDSNNYVQRRTNHIR